MIKKNKAPVIGVDLDNTIIYYDQALYELAVRHGFLANIPLGENLTKQQIRDRIRFESGNDIEWQKMQAELYTTGLSKATFFEGVLDFFKEIKEKSINAYVVSHKTEFASYDLSKTSLRQAAIDWLDAQGFFDPNIFAFLPEYLFFSSTRSEKIEIINKLGCTHFIDDLIEVFNEETFPENTIKMHFDPGNLDANDELVIPNYFKFSSWKEITAYFRGS